MRREVIIVLTPYVLPERLHLSRALPKNSAMLDDTENELFRNSYRIHREDIQDVAFLYRNERFLTYRRLALAGIQETFQLTQQEPFYSFAEKRLPGEHILVNRILHNAIARLQAADIIDIEKIFLLTNHEYGGHETDDLESILGAVGGGGDIQSFFEDRPDQALAISFYDPYETSGGASLVSDPVPEIQLMKCPNRKAWLRLLVELNRPRQDQRRRHTILIHREEDLDRLRRAFMTKFVLQVNGGSGPEASLIKFLPGRIIQLPDLQAHQPLLIKAVVARNFFHSTQHYYAATIEQIEAALNALDVELRKPQFKHLLGNADRPITRMYR